MRIAIYFENTASSRNALIIANNTALQTDAELFVVKTLSRDNPIKHSQLEKMEEAFSEKVDQLTAYFGSIYKSRFLISAETDGEQIVRFIRRKKIDLFFIGTPQKSRLAKLIIGSTALYVILNSTCPVVTINALANVDSCCRQNE